jgi:ABC-type transporter Mla subunit MlaD
MKSIEVSVKDIGNEVTTRLKDMLTQDLGKQIEDMMRDTMSEAASLSERLKSELISAFERAIQDELPKMLASLEAIQKSVDGQASSPIERMLEQLQTVVAGGMRGESAQMNAAMKQFADVVPGLANQLRDVAETMTREVRERTTESARANESLVTQISSLLTRLETQQTATDRAIAEIAHASSAGADAMMGRLQSGSTELMGELLKSSRTEIDQVLAKLQAAAHESANGYGSIGASVEGAARSIAEVRDGLKEAADTTRTMSAETRAVIQDARVSSDAAQRAAQSFESAAGSLKTSIDQMNAAITQGRTYGSEQKEMIAEHRKFMHELEQMWPKLFDKYLTSYDEKSRLLERSWVDV